MSVAYFRITSDSLTLAEITDITQEDADDGWSLGEMYTGRGMVAERPRPFSSWKRFSSAGHGLSVQESLDGLFDPVERIAERISARSEIACSLQIVQYFSNPKAEIGFNFHHRWLALLASMPASIDVDQYR